MQKKNINRDVQTSFYPEKYFTWGSILCHLRMIPANYYAILRPSISPVSPILDILPGENRVIF